MIRIFNHILFICTGNTCRSPFAEAMFRKMLREKYQERADNIEVLSAGTYAFPGVTPPPNAVRISRKFGVDISSHKSRVVHLNLMETADQIFCMTSRHKSHLVSKFPWFEDKIFVLKKYAEGIVEEKATPEHLSETDDSYDIEDPIGQGLEVYTDIFGQVQDCLEKVIHRWENEEEFRKKMSRKLKVAVASDHAGFGLKQDVVSYLGELGHQAVDFGTDSGDVSVDYPDYARPAAEAVSNGTCDLGILVCGSGVGVSIVANKVRGVRSALCRSALEARLAMQHDHSNVLSLGGRFTTPLVARDIIKTWLSTEFEGGRHQRRVNKMEKLDEA